MAKADWGRIVLLAVVVFVGGTGLGLFTFAPWWTYCGDHGYRQHVIIGAGSELGVGVDEPLGGWDAYCQADGRDWCVERDSLGRCVPTTNCDTQAAYDYFNSQACKDTHHFCGDPVAPNPDYIGVSIQDWLKTEYHEYAWKCPAGYYCDYQHTCQEYAEPSSTHEMGILVHAELTGTEPILSGEGSCGDGLCREGELATCIQDCCALNPICCEPPAMWPPGTDCVNVVPDDAAALPQVDGDEYLGEGPIVLLGCAYEPDFVCGEGMHCDEANNECVLDEGAVVTQEVVGESFFGFTLLSLDLTQWAILLAALGVLGYALFVKRK